MNVMFYCFHCNTAHRILKEKEKKYFCPKCDRVVFKSKKELDNYILSEESNIIEPFEKTKQRRENERHG